VNIKKHIKISHLEPIYAIIKGQTKNRYVDLEEEEMIDQDGYRANVGIMLSNDRGELLWARRSGQDGWQFPQGGIQKHETPQQALFRELKEEVGLEPNEVEIVNSTKDWLRYDLPKKLQRPGSKPKCIGQKQIWFLLKLNASEHEIKLDCSERPEFDTWCWIAPHLAAEQVVEFKKNIYRLALTTLLPDVNLILNESMI